MTGPRATAAVLALLAATPAWALDGAWPRVVVGAGLAVETVKADGTWYQLGNPHHLDTTPDALSLGLVGDLPHGWRWNASLVSLGTARARCLCTPRDDFYNTATHRQLPGAPVPNANYVGSGRVTGVKLTLSPSWTRGDWTWGIEAGLFAYHSTWRENAYGWSYDPALGNARGGKPITNTLNLVKENYVRPTVGAWAQRGPWTASLDLFDLRTTSDKNNGPSLTTGAAVILVSYTF